ncbi:MAG: hypothetical protein EBU90_30620 [Proteobacteria bacterium]|nr:hypothetical protein [Pseudomonadota bacterium]
MVAVNTAQFDMVLDVQCVHCSGKHVLFVKIRDYIKWKYNEGFIQELLPYLTAGERELLISRTCSDCFNRLYPPLDISGDE